LEDIKNIVRHIKADGHYPCGLSGNKNHLVNLLKDITKKSNHKSNPETPSSQLNCKLSKNTKPNTVLPYTNQPQPNRSYSTPSSTTFPNGIQCQIPPTNNTTLPTEVNSISKQQVFSKLIGYPGIKREELLLILSQFSPYDTVKAESVMMRIVAHRQEQQNRELQRKENELYDQAVMESEKERDAVKIRKRQYVEDLKTKFDRSLLSAEELSTSILLHELHPSLASTNKTNSFSQSSSQSNATSTVEIISLIDDDEEEPSRKKNKQHHSAGGSVDSLCYSGCRAIKRIVKSLDSICSFACQTSSSQPPQPIDSSSVALRLSVSRLLLAEVDCIKAYGKQSYPYIVKMGQRIDYSLANNSVINILGDRAAVEKATAQV